MRKIVLQVLSYLCGLNEFLTDRSFAAEEQVA